MSNLDSEIGKQLYELIDKNHSIVTKELGDQLIKDLTAFIQQREYVARIDEVKNIPNPFDIYARDGVVIETLTDYRSHRIAELTQPIEPPNHLEDWVRYEAMMLQPPNKEK